MSVLDPQVSTKEQARKAYREFMLATLFKVNCKCCSFPLAPHQMQRGLCSVCDGTFSKTDATDFEFMAMPEGYRG
jgi:hypothetical protein